MNDVEKCRQIVSVLLKKQILVTAELLSKLKDPEYLGRLHDTLSTNPEKIQELICQEKPSVGVKTQVSDEIGILYDFSSQASKRSVGDVVKYMHARYCAIEKMLRQRQEMQNTTSISRLLQKKEREQVSAIGLVLDKRETKNGNIILTLEDPTGTIKALVHKNKQQVLDLAQDIMLDECIGVSGSIGDQIIFVNSILLPDIPLTNELKKSPEECYAAVVSDIHLGSTLFLKKQFENFIDWTKGSWGSDEQKKAASKLRYIFIVGDAIDGIGVYPGHEQELNIKDLYDQYDALAAYLRQIPPYIRIILSPGNHDAVRIAEPQPKLDADFSKSLYTIPNVTLVSNPAMVTVCNSSNFPGLKCLLYHGFSFSFYGDRVHSIKNSGKNVSDRVDLIGKYLLQRRHLAPSYGSTQYSTESGKDDLVIDVIPDLFLSGHIHKASASTYRGVSIVSGSCFQDTTSFQRKMGHEPNPGLVPVINLQTRMVNMVNFNDV